MISAQVLRRYPFFAGLRQENVEFLASVSEEINAESGHYFFKEDDVIDHFYVVMQGVVSIVVEIPMRNVDHSLSDLFTHAYRTEDVTVTSVGPGELFGWSGLVPPHETMASAKALTACRVIAFDCQPILERFESDCHFGYLMLLKTAQVIRSRLRDSRIESISEAVAV